MRTQTGTAIHLEDYRPSDYLIEQVHLTVKLHATQTEVTAQLQMRRRKGIKKDTPLVLAGDELSLTSLMINDENAKKTDYVAAPDSLTVSAVPVDETFTLTLVTKINPTANKKLMGLYRTSGNFCTQCEAEGFRRITYFLDRPDVLAVYTVRLEGDKKAEPLLLSNGNCIEKGDLDDGRHFAIWHDPHPKPSYLFALFAGDLGVLKDQFTTVSGRKVALEIYVEHGKEARAAYAMDSLIRSMKWDEEVYGCEYDLDIFMIVAVSDFNMGAMENKGLNVFNDKYVLADPQTATDADYANIEAIIAHEYFHNWTGNRITCRDWFQLCLKEGLTVYRDHSFSADQRSASVKRIAEVRGLRAHQFPEDSGPLAHPVRPRQYSEINNFYTSTVYEKGSEVVGMLKTILGADGFRKGMDLYFERHDGDAATIEDFLSCFAEATGENLRQFALWYDQSGTPNIAFEASYNADEKRFTVVLKQSVKSIATDGTPKAMHIPLRFGLVGEDGTDLAWSAVTGADISGDVIHLKKKRQEIVFEGVSSKPVLSLLRGFSAPVTTVPGRSEADLAFLARNDSDDFSRWEALTGFLISQLRQQTVNIKAQKLAKTSPILLQIIREIIENEALEPAYRALCLILPSESDIAREIGSDIDPDAIYEARNVVLNDIAKACEKQFATLVEKLDVSGAFSPDASAAGRRALRNSAIGYLCRAKGDYALALETLERADNMTDRADMLQILAYQAPEQPQTIAALEAFKKTYENEPIVLDKWFSIQATTTGPGSLDLVKKLTEDEHFSFENPNRIRSLIGAFCVGNSTGFNRADGAGYRYLCETAEKLDAINPQVTARLMTALRSWRTLEPKRRDHAINALNALSAKKNLSRDLRDILDRTLAK